MSEQQLERSMLDGKDREELHAIAGAMGVRGVTRMRKADLVEAILAAAGANGAAANGAEPDKPKRVRSRKAAAVDPIAALAAEEDALAAATGDTPEPAPRTAPSARTQPDTTDRETSTDPAVDRPASNGTAADGSAPADTASTDDGDNGDNGTTATASTTGPAPARTDDDDRQSFGEGNRRRRRRRGRDRDRDRQYEGGSRPEEPVGEPVEVHGLLDLRDEGYGFLRTTSYLPGPKDVYVSASQVRRFGLRKGDFVLGATRPPASNEKYPALLRVDEINGMSSDDARTRARFEDLTPLFPDERLRLELSDDPSNMTGRIVDLISPIGKGQRGLIVSPQKAGQTTILKQLVYSIERNNPEVHLMVLLVDERPEEVTDMRRHVVRGEVVASTFDRPSEEHTQVAELTIERAKRLVELGNDVVIVLDGITRLARAYNLAQPASGRILSGGVDATALIETGSRMDEVIFEEFKGTGNMELRLDRRLAERRIYPAIDVEASSTRHEELLFDRSQLQQVWKLRRVLNALEGGAGLELLIDKIRTTRSNDEFLAEIAKAPSPGG